MHNLMGVCMGCSQPIHAPIRHVRLCISCSLIGVAMVSLGCLGDVEVLAHPDTMAPCGETYLPNLATARDPRSVWRSD